NRFGTSLSSPKKPRKGSTQLSASGQQGDHLCSIVSPALERNFSLACGIAGTRSGADPGCTWRRHGRERHYSALSHTCRSVKLYVGHFDTGSPQVPPVPEGLCPPRGARTQLLVVSCRTCCQDQA